MGTFNSLNTAASGLRASKAAMEIIANNIANANTPGYKRQIVQLSEGNPLTSAWASKDNIANFTGSGVKVQGIVRIQDAFLDNRINDAQQSKAQWSAARDLLSAVEATFNEPTENGLSTLLDHFWNSWRELEANPKDLTARTALAFSSDSLAVRIREIHTTLTNMQKSIDQTIINRVDEINRIARDIGEVNEKIVALETGGYAPNELLNRRDALVEELSKIIAVKTSGNTGGDFMLNVGGITMIQGTRVSQMTTVKDPVSQREMPVWDVDKTPVYLASGEMRGLIDVRDGNINAYIGRLNSIASALIGQVNQLHSAGFDMNGNPAGNFFNPIPEGDRIYDPAAIISIRSEILANPALIAAGDSSEESNSNIASAIADLSGKPLINGETISKGYSTLISQIGGDVGIADRSAKTREYTLEQLQRQRDSISGVSLDDEMVDMVRFQQMFAASARIFEASDFILRTLVDMV